MPVDRVTPAMARRIELWPVGRLAPYQRNPRTHTEEQITQIAASIAEFGFCNPILVDSRDGIVAGHGRLLAAKKLGLAEVPVIVLDHLSETQRRAYLLADNRLSELAGWDHDLLALELKELADAGFDATLAGFDSKEIDDFLASLERDAERERDEVEDAIPQAPAEAVTQPGDLWLIGPHRLVCGDCRDKGVIARLFEDRKANVVVTSPPYATQRQYDPASGFDPVPPEKYVAWFRYVAAAIESVIAPDGSYFLNIKAHAEEGERHTYVMDLVLAHKRQWGWRFVDEFCWRKTDDGVPGGWTWTAPGNRTWQPGLTNPIWITVNMLLRARGIRMGANATAPQLDFAETLFDVDASVAAAAICDEQVTKLVGTITETQFQFRGVLQEERPLRDWLQEVLMNCLGYYTFANGKLKRGVRVNSPAVEAFTEGNILLRSLQLAPLKPVFNHLTANFADEDFEFVANSISLYDIDHPTRIGGAAGLLFLKSTVNLAGTASKSQAARIKPYNAGRVVKALKELAETIGPLPRVKRSPDPTDDFLLALSIAGRADYLVTGDKSGLLALTRHQATRIVSARDFAASFG